MNPIDLTESDIAGWLKARAAEANFHGNDGGNFSVCTSGAHVLFSLMAWTGETHIHASAETLADAQAEFSKKADPLLRAAGLRAAADKILAKAEGRT